MSAVRKFEVVRGDRAAATVETGTFVFENLGWDYGVASDDSRMTGIEHTSVTLNEDGSYPFFTIPSDDIREVKP